MKKTFLQIILMLIAYLCGAQATSYQFNGEQGVFTENMGQVVDEQGLPMPDVLAKASITGLDIYITKTGVTYVLQKYEVDLSAKPHPVYINEKKYKIKYSRFDVALTGATLGHDQMLWADAAGWKSNYYKTPDGKGQLAVEHFKTLTIQNVYPGIDWVWKFNAQNKPEYDFVVHAGADVSAIKMQYSYADLLLGKNKLTISTHVGSLTEGPLQASCNSAKVQISYVVDSKIKEVSFTATGYDKSKDLLIDPPLALDWSAQFGGSFLNGLRGVTPDSSGHIYMVGYTTSADFPTHGISGNHFPNYFYDSTYNGQTDAVLIKLDTLQHLLYATFLGGPGNDFANSVSYYNNVVCLTGGANTGFPDTYGAVATGQDAFLTVLDSGMNMLYSTFIGGNGTDEGLKVCVDYYGQNVYVAGFTNSSSASFPSFCNCGFSPNLRNTVVGQEGFISAFKFNQNYNFYNSFLNPAWSNKFGGSGDDYATSIITFPSNVIYIAGFTNSTDITINHYSNGFLQASNGGGFDGFIAECFSNDGEIGYDTYFGGSGDDYFTDGTINALSAKYFTGRTNSANFPLKNVSGFGYNQSHLADSADDAFIVNFDPVGNLQWSTYFGGNGADAGTGITTDINGQIYVTGFTFSSNLPVQNSQGSFFQPVNHGNADGFIARFTEHGIKNWCTYKGDSCYQYPASIAYDNKFNHFYIAGEGLLACGPPNADSGGISLPDTGLVNNSGVSSIGFCWDFGGQNTVAPTCLVISIKDSVVPCPTQCNGIAIASVLDGTPPYSFYWSSGSNINIADSLCATSFYYNTWVQVKDSSGCAAEAAVELDPLSWSGGQTSEVSCSVFSITYFPTGGNMDSAYNYLWSTHTDYTHVDSINVTPGTYTLTITDAIGCSVSVSTNVAYNTSFYVDPIYFNYPDCRDSDGQLAFDYSYVDSTGYSWTWPNGLVIPGNILNNIYNTKPGTFYIGTDSTECVNGKPYIMHYLMSMPSALALISLLRVNPTSCNPEYGDGSLSAEINNTPPCIVTDSAGDSIYTISFYDQGFFDFTYLWSNGSTASSIDNLSPGLYSVTVTMNSYLPAGSNGQCDTVIYIYLPYPNSNYNVTSNVTQATCGDGGGGSVTITGVTGGGGAPYAYLWSTGATTTSISNLQAGNYNVTISGYSDCPISQGFTVDTSNTGLPVSLSSAGITCAPGTVRATANGGTGPYQYEWSTSPGSFGDSASIFVADSGKYVVTVEDVHGCMGIDSIHVNYSNSPPQIDSIFALQYPACGISNGIIVIKSPNPSNITWILPDGTIEHGDTIFNAPANWQNIIINDSSFCNWGEPTPVQYSIGISPLNAGLNFYTDYLPSGCDTKNGQVEAWILGDQIWAAVNIEGQYISEQVKLLGVSPLTFQWSTGLTVVRTDSDFVNPNYYTYGWSEIDSLDPGTYSVTVTSGTCNNSSSITITASQPPLIANYQITNANCGGNGGGSIHLVSLQNNIPDVYGDTTNTFVWSNGATTGSITNLSAGTYTVTITGPNACPVIDTFVVGTSNTGLPVTLSSAGITCAPGTVTATANGGTGPYQYEWSINPGTFTNNASISVSDTESYEVTVLDANGCSGSGTVDVGYNNLPLPFDSLIIEQYPSCGLSNGVIYIESPNPSKISWNSNINGTTTVTHGDTLRNASATDSGDYFIVDSSYCVNGQPVPISYLLILPDPINKMAGFGHFDCGPKYLPTGCNTSDGVIGTDWVTFFSIGTNVSPYQNNYPNYRIVNYPQVSYQWSNGYIDTFYDTVNRGLVNGNFAPAGPSLSGLNPGTYYLTVTDGACQFVDTIQLTDSLAPLIANYAIASPTCTADTNDGIHLVSLQNNPSGFFANTFAWSNGATTSSIHNLAVGTYTVTITGPNACPVIDTFQVDSGIPLVVKDSITPIACYDSSARVIVTATGGTLPYFGTGTFIKAPGSYVLTVTDSNGCSSNDSIIVRPSRAQSALVVGDSFTVINCYGGYADLIIYATGGVLPYTGTGVNPVQAGPFAYPVTDSLGCKVMDTGHISQPPALLVSDTVGPILCYGGSAAVTLHATGGTSPYTGTGTFIEPMGDYTLFVTDDNGCKDSVHIAITGQPTPLEINITVQDTAALCRDTLGALVSASGGTPPYTGPTAVVYTHNGNYTITVTDHNGCRADSVLAVHLDTCTGIETLTAGTGVLVYPNPTTNQFYVKFELPVTTETDLRLYAADGKLVLLKTLNTGANLGEMDCSLLASGVYILNTYTGGRQFYFKVVIER